MPATVSTEKVRSLVSEGAQLLEVLPQAAYDEEHLPGAVNIPLPSLTPQAAEQLDRKRPVVVYCYDTECDLSARGAALLELYGFEQVFDYTGSKTEWLGMGLPAEGSLRSSDRAGGRARPVPTCAPDDPVDGLVFDDVTARCVVVTGSRVILGSLRREAAGLPAGTPASRAMEPGPPTVRPSISRAELARSMVQEGQRSVLVSGLDGRLIGIVTVEDLQGS